MAKLNGRIMDHFLVRPEPVPPPPLRFVVPTNMKAGALKALDDILMLFGPGGRNWITGDGHLKFEKGDLHPVTNKEIRQAFDGFCLIGAVEKVDGAYEGIARLAIAWTIAEREKLVDLDDPYYADESVDVLTDAETITKFNDEQTRFKEIKAVVVAAKKLVRDADTE